MDFVGGKIKGYVASAQFGASDVLQAVIVVFVEPATATS